MRRIAVLIASAAINASTIPSLAAQCTSNKDIDASCARSATVQSQPANAADKEKVCRAYAASFYESVMLREGLAEDYQRRAEKASLVDAAKVRAFRNAGDRA
jgi:hypothetical protein